MVVDSLKVLDPKRPIREADVPAGSLLSYVILRNRICRWCRQSHQSGLAGLLGNVQDPFLRAANVTMIRPRATALPFNWALARKRLNVSPLQKSGVRSCLRPWCTGP
jgi:hypothetical protein